MTARMPVVTERADGKISIDWPDGPYITLAKAQWDALLQKIRTLSGGKP
jgi:hypothetical protein